MRSDEAPARSPTPLTSLSPLVPFKALSSPHRGVESSVDPMSRLTHEQHLSHSSDNPPSAEVAVEEGNSLEATLDECLLDLQFILDEEQEAKTHLRRVSGLLEDASKATEQVSHTRLHMHTPPLLSLITHSSPIRL